MKKTKRAKAKPAKKVIQTKRKASAHRPSPRSQTLPGMSQIRSGRLDNLCEAIADCRGQMNSAKAEEVGLIQSALQTMVARGVQVYKHGGVELARVPGAEKLRVRLVKEQGDATEADLEGPDDVDHVDDGLEAAVAEAHAEDDDAEGMLH